jgi:hypothetical protein
VWSFPLRFGRLAGGGFVIEKLCVAPTAASHLALFDRDAAKAGAGLPAVIAVVVTAAIVAAIGVLPLQAGAIFMPVTFLVAPPVAMRLFLEPSRILGVENGAHRSQGPVQVFRRRLGRQREGEEAGKADG